MPGDNDTALAAGALAAAWIASENEVVRVDLSSYISCPRSAWQDGGDDLFYQILETHGFDGDMRDLIDTLVETVHAALAEEPGRPILDLIFERVPAYQGEFNAQIERMAKAITLAKAIAEAGAAATPEPAPVVAPVAAPVAPAAVVDPISAAVAAFVALVLSEDAKAAAVNLAAYAVPTVDELMDAFDSHLAPALDAAKIEGDRYEAATDLFTKLRDELEKDPGADLVAFVKDEFNGRTGWNGRIEALAKACGWTGKAAPQASATPAKPPPAATPTPVVPPPVATQPQVAPDTDPFATVASSGGPSKPAPASTASTTQSGSSDEGQKGRRRGDRGKQEEGGKESDKDAELPPEKLPVVTVVIPPTPRFSIDLLGNQTFMKHLRNFERIARDTPARIPEVRKRIQEPGNIQIYAVAPGSVSLYVEFFDGWAAAKGDPAKIEELRQRFRLTEP